MRGIHKQIVVLNEVENPLFEQAIFILKPAVAEKKNNPDEVLRQARRVVETYACRNGLGTAVKTRPAHLKQKLRSRLFYYIGGSILLLALISSAVLYFF